MSSRPTFIPVLMLLAIGALAAPSVSAQCDEIPGCVLVWSDEFDGTEVDPSKWSFMVGDGTSVGLPPGWGNNELQYYRAENATVADGFLTITAKEEDFLAHEYTSARLRTLGKGDWTYGRFEMRAKAPIGAGFWSAFWMLPSDSLYGGWAASGEIDIMEHLGDEPYRVLGTIHYGGPWPYNRYSGTHYDVPVGSLHDSFHTYAIEWELGEIRWYLDDVLYLTQNAWYSIGGPYPAPFNTDFHLLLNMAVGGNLPGPPNSFSQFPQELVVDYVRVYQLPPLVTLTGPAAGATLAPGDSLTVTAEITEAVPIERVEFLQGKGVLGVDEAPPYEVTVPSVSAGCYMLRARAWDDTGTAFTSTPVGLTVGAGCPQARVSVGGARRPKEEAASRSLPAFSSPSYAISRASHRSHPFSPSCASSHRTPTSASEEEEDRV